VEEKVDGDKGKKEKKQKNREVPRETGQRTQKTLKERWRR